MDDQEYEKKDLAFQTLAGKIFKPPLGDAQVWRYMSLAGLIQILQTNSVFFPRLTKFEDPYEGAMPVALRRVIEETAQPRSSAQQLIQNLERDTHSACVSCWHINDGESAAMWKLYSHKSGIAIRSSISGIKRGFRSQDYNMACVEYVDFDDSNNPPNFLYPVYLKRKSFSHEQELRLVTYESDATAYPHGKHVPADVAGLVEQIFVSPVEPDWLTDVVRQELEQHGVQRPVIQSKLYSRTLK